jgi:predicted nucleotidyltransferase component of viral defense system
MKDYLRQILESTPDKLSGLSVVREYLQTRILQGLQDGGAFRAWIFHGGTALRFLYGMPRYSEDLDFALRVPGLSEDFASILKRVKTSFLSEGYQVEVKVKTDKNVKMAFFRFQGLLFELNLTPHSDQVLPIKIELDTLPPAGGGWTTSVVRRYVPLHLLHYDKSSLLGGKLNAIFTQPYVKGRDIYDLVWYLSDRSWPIPNIPFLNNALRQLHWKGPTVTEENWKLLMIEKINTLNWQTVRNDVEPFLERKGDIELLTRKNLLGLLG